MNANWVVDHWGSTMCCKYQTITIGTVAGDPQLVNQRFYPPGVSPHPKRVHLTSVENWKPTGFAIGYVKPTWRIPWVSRSHSAKMILAAKV